MKASVVFYFLIAIWLLNINCIHAQILTYDHGKVEFYTSSILSDIEATSEEIDISLNATTGDVNIRIPIESFEFEYEMMQDHFNEEYMESDQFPEATFAGKINEDIANLTETLDVTVEGVLTIHGVQKETSFNASLSIKDGFTHVACTFPIILKDFNIEEPSVLSKSLARDVELKTELFLK